jgi:Tol biopolymer transport system component
VSEEGVESNGDSYIVPSHSISDDGNLIVFDSGASNIAEGDMNGAQDVFVYRKEDGKIRRVTHAFDGGDIDDYAVASYITGDGTKITFESAATNLVEGDTNNFGDVFIMDTPSFDSPSYQSHHARLTGGNQLRRLLILSGLSSFNFEEMFQIPSRE